MEIKVLHIDPSTMDFIIAMQKIREDGLQYMHDKLGIPPERLGKPGPLPSSKELTP